MQIYVNYLAVLGAAFVSTVIGTVWYSHALFGKKWKFDMGWADGSPEDLRKGMAKRYSISLLSSFVLAFVLAYFIKILGVTDAFGALIITIWIWLGFIATAATHSVLWEKRPWGLYFINVFYYLVSIFVMSLILTFWG
jgi:hypothetical protein